MSAPDLMYDAEHTFSQLSLLESFMKSYVCTCVLQCYSSTAEIWSDLRCWTHNTHNLSQCILCRINSACSQPWWQKQSVAATQTARQRCRNNFAALQTSESVSIVLIKSADAREDLSIAESAALAKLHSSATSFATCFAVPSNVFALRLHDFDTTAPTEQP